MQTLVETLGFTLAVVAASLPIGTLLAVLLARTNLPGRRLFAALVAIHLGLPLYLQAAGWQAGFGLFGVFYPVEFGAPWLDGWRGAVWVHAAATVPWVVLIVGLGLRLTPSEPEELALTEGPPAWVLRKVTLPQVRLAIVAAALWIGLLTAGEMTVTDLFAVETYAREVYTLLSLGATPQEALAASLPFCVIAIVLVGLAIGVCHRALGEPAPPAVRPRVVFDLGRWRWLAGLGVVAIFTVMLGMPLAGLVAKAGIVVEATDGDLARRFEMGQVFVTTAKMARIHWTEFGWSLLIGSLAALAAVAVGLPLAWRARHGGRRAWPALGVVGVFAAMPGPLVGLAIIGLLNRRDLPWLTALYDHSILAPWLAQTVRTLPVVVLVLWAAFRSVPREVLEMAALDGAGPMQQFVSIALPMRWAAVIVAWLVALVLALGELSASILVLPPGVTTVAQRMFGLLHATAGDEVAGMGLVQAAVIAPIALFVLWLASRLDRD